jgi:hypothetical protein
MRYAAFRLLQAWRIMINKFLIGAERLAETSCQARDYPARH